MQVYVEGNIGTGKTTFLQFLDKNINDSTVVYEPVDEWITLKDSDGKNILQKFYEDQNRWSFAFQMNSFISRIKKIENSKSELNFIERSVFTDNECFATNCYENGKMTKLEYNIYSRWHNWLCEKFEMKPKVFIYLKALPEVSFERIKNRSRSEETGITLDYLKQLHTLHEEWMLRNIENGAKVLYLDVNHNFYESEKESEKIKETVKEFIQTLQSV
jgi:deoxyadenosine/deoxycytidine kinase